MTGLSAIENLINQYMLNEFVPFFSKEFELDEEDVAATWSRFVGSDRPTKAKAAKKSRTRRAPSPQPVGEGEEVSEKLSLIALKNICKCRGLKVTGTKSQLVCRIKEAELQCKGGEEQPSSADGESDQQPRSRSRSKKKSEEQLRAEKELAEDLEQTFADFAGGFTEEEEFPEERSENDTDEPVVGRLLHPQKRVVEEKERQKRKSKKKSQERPKKTSKFGTPNLSENSDSEWEADRTKIAARKALKSVKKRAANDKPPVIRMMEEKKPKIELITDDFGNIVHEETGIAFSHDEEEVDGVKCRCAIGYVLESGHLEELTKEKMEVCQRYGFRFLIPQNFDV